QRLQRKEQVIADLTEHLGRRRVGQDSLQKWLRRSDMDWAQLCEMEPSLREWAAPADAIEQVVLEGKYAGYIDRQTAQIERFHKLESKPIPEYFDYLAVPQLRAEAKEKLTRVRPASLGQASRISGISPADLAVVLLYLETSPSPSSVGD